MPISAKIRSILLVRGVWTFSWSASFPCPSFFLSFLLTFYVVLWKLASPLDILWAIGLSLNLSTSANTTADRTHKISFCFVRPELLFFFIKLVMSNMSNERRVTPTVIYFPYSAICNLWLVIHYSSVRSGRSPMANSRGKFTGTREIISALFAIWKISQETYRVPLFCLSQGLALHRSSDPVLMTNITRDLCEKENHIYCLGISGGLLRSSGTISKCLWMLAPRRLSWKWRIRYARTEGGVYLEN